MLRKGSGVEVRPTSHNAHFERLQPYLIERRQSCSVCLHLLHCLCVYNKWLSIMIRPNPERTLNFTVRFRMCAY